MEVGSWYMHARRALHTGTKFFLQKTDRTSYRDIFMGLEKELVVLIQLGGGTHFNEDTL